MAEVQDVSLKIGVSNYQGKTAEISYSVVFSDAELRLNIKFREFVLLFDIKGEKDQYFREYDHPFSLERIYINGKDRNVVYIANGSRQFSPNGFQTIGRKVNIEWQKDIDFPSPHLDVNYQALVWVTPEIFDSSSMSNIVKIESPFSDAGDMVR